MKFKILVFGLIGLVLISGKVHSVENVGNAEWKKRMQSMLSDVLILFPFAFDEKRFNDPFNRPKIKEALGSLNKHSAELSKHTSKLTHTEGLKIDPSFPFVAEAFESELQVAKNSFDAGNASQIQSQTYLRAALTKCILCHTQSANGPELKIDQFKDQLGTLNSQDRFMALAATRQFDDALAEFSKILAEKKESKPDLSRMDNEIRAALAIAVRVKKDPATTLKLINETITSGSGSKIIQSDLKSWKKSAMEWSAEKPLLLNSDEALFTEGNRLVEQSKKIEYSLDSYQNSSIQLLRASSYLHDLLSNYSVSAYRAKSYILLASIYDLLPGFALWDLPDEYLGACIKENPHSEAGEKCFDEYSKLIVLGYSGSSGIHIPWAVRQHLESMKTLATREVPKKEKPKQK